MPAHVRYVSSLPAYTRRALEHQGLYDSAVLTSACGSPYIKHIRCPLETKMKKLKLKKVTLRNLNEPALDLQIYLL
jgi:hypothetical protein